MIADYNLTNFDEIVVPIYFIYTDHSLDLDDERFHGCSQYLGSLDQVETLPTIKYLDFQ